MKNVINLSCTELSQKVVKVKQFIDSSNIYTLYDIDIK